MIWLSKIPGAPDSTEDPVVAVGVDLVVANGRTARVAADSSPKLALSADPIPLDQPLAVPQVEAVRSRSAPPHSTPRPSSSSRCTRCRVLAHPAVAHHRVLDAARAPHPLWKYSSRQEPGSRRGRVQVAVRVAAEAVVRPRREHHRLRHRPHRPQRRTARGTAAACSRLNFTTTPGSRIVSVAPAFTVVLPVTRNTPAAHVVSLEIVPDTVRHRRRVRRGHYPRPRLQTQAHVAAAVLGADAQRVLDVPFVRPSTSRVVVSAPRLSV